MLFLLNWHYFWNHHTQKPMVWYAYVYIIFVLSKFEIGLKIGGWNDLNCIKGKHWYSKVILFMFKVEGLESVLASICKRDLYFIQKRSSVFFEVILKCIMVAKSEVRMLFLMNENCFFKQYNRNPLVWYWHICNFKFIF